MIPAGNRLRRLALVLCVAYGAGLAAETAAAVEPPSSSHNFSAPNYVPNYFSNETAPFRGASGGQTASPGGGPVVVAPGIAAHPNIAYQHVAPHHSVQGRYRARAVRGSAGRHGRYVAHARGMSRGGKAAARHGSSVRGKAIAGTRRAAPVRAHGGKAQGKTQRIARAHG